MGELNTAEEKINNVSGAAGQYKESQGPGLPSQWKTPVAGAQINSGSYVGNNTVNRAIAHGLGIAPKMVFIRRSVADYWGDIITGSANIYYMHDAASGLRAVTAMNATNFYVGNAADYNQSMNATGATYYWVAIG